MGSAGNQPVRIVVDVMPKPEILDPQGKAISGALVRMGHRGFSVRQGKRFEIESQRPLDDAVLAEVAQFAETLLANPVIENFTVRVPREDSDAGAQVREVPRSGADSTPGFESPEHSCEAETTRSRGDESCGVTRGEDDVVVKQQVPLGEAEGDA